MELRGDMHEIVTDKLRLRAIEPGDVEHYFRLLTDPEVMKYIGVQQGRILSREEVVNIVDIAVDAWKTRGYARWSVFERATDEFVGFAGFRCEEGMPELLVVVHEKFWGSGYAGKACRACLDYAFENLGFETVFAVSRPENDRARGMLERLGFRFDAIIDFHGVEGAAYRLMKPESDTLPLIADPAPAY